MGRVKSYKDLVSIKEGKEYLKCTKCNTEKELTEENFYKKDKGENWICICKECKKGYYQENKEHRQEYQLKYAEENKDYYHEYAKRYDKKNGGVEGFSMKDFRQGIIPEVDYKPIAEKLIHIDGEVTTDNGSKYTRLVGGFGEEKPIITIKQISNILNLDIRVINQTINRNIKDFRKDIDIIDLKEKSITVSDRDFETMGYSKQSVSNSKNIYILSQSGFLLYLRYAEGDEATNIYKSFIEDYFKTKVELAVAEKTIQENSNVLLDTKKMLLGSAFLETDEKKKFDMFMQIEDINRQLIENARTLAKEETIEQFKDVIAIADRFTNSKECYDIGIFSKLLDIPGMGRTNMFKFLREEKLLQGNNAPYQNMTDKFKVIKVSNNGFECRKTLLKGDGIKFVVNRLIKKGYINNLTTNEVLEKLKDIQAA